MKGLQIYRKIPSTVEHRGTCYPQLVHIVVNRLSVLFDLVGGGCADVRRLTVHRSLFDRLPSVFTATVVVCGFHGLHRKDLRSACAFATIRSALL